ncbi:hypothetical protein GETHLI_25670 [Geothrix limicola]|uniref:DUF4403 family protein n=1 Tax=Geothrix limicola TaxID=2927978 RepID=A0ABQ5QGS8_9BACT|nr:DUF4403 family protein [Geothrix limicola]GLH74065.1 hypothetical protein GETHLI_25670 [Geothrix limicola]
MRLSPCLLTFALPLVGQVPSAFVEELEPSTLSLPIRVDLAPLLKQVEAQVPLSPPNIETWGEIKGKPRSYFRFNLIREPLSVHVKGAQVSVRVVANFGMDVGLRTLGNHYTVMGSCGRNPEPPRRVMLDLNTSIGLLPSWGVELRQTAFEVTPLNTCEVTFLGFDITDQVTAGMKENLKAGADTLARLVRENALARQKAQEAWVQFSQPIELGKDLYLVFQPRHVRLAPLSTQGRTLVITPEIEAQPRLVLGARPQAETTPLPDLELNASPRPGFRLRVEADLAYTHASQQLAAQVVGKTFETAKGRFEITSARVWGDQGKALLEIGLKGRITGKVTLSGKPLSDPATSSLRLADLDFTLDSQSWLARMGDWIYHSDLQKLITDKAHFLMDQQFQGLRDMVQTGLNRQLAPNLRLSGSLKAFRVAAVTTGPDGFKSQAYLEGEVQVDMK